MDSGVLVIRWFVFELIRIIIIHLEYTTAPNAGQRSEGVSSLETCKVVDAQMCPNSPDRVV